MFHAINLWSSSYSLVLLNCESLNVFRATSSQSKFVMACPCSLSELDRSWLQYVVIQQQLSTEELFSQLPMYLLLKHPCNNKMKRRLSTWLLHKLNFEFLRPLINCTLKETTALTISQVGFTICRYVWKQSNMVHEKFPLQYIVCADNLSNMSCCLVRQQSRLMFMLAIYITGIWLTCQIMNPTSVWVLTAVGA